MVRLRRDPLRIGAFEFNWGSRTYVMGIVNVTPDSFSGDGITSVDAALERARQMEADGADLIDVGAESTRPETWTGPGLPETEEIARVLPVIEAIARAVRVPVSIDTYKAAVARRAIAAGAGIVNDVFGLRRDPVMAAVVAEAGVPVIVMHNGATPAGADLVDEIRRGLEESLALATGAGIDREQILIDPGIGFGKDREGNLEILRRLAEFRGIDCPILVGPSRKSFIGKTLDLPVGDRLEGTAAAVALSIAGGADVVRVHDVRAMVRVARMADAIVRGTQA
ncbi:MAG: dihydropteroate synthase [Candidatus Dormibacteraeota bacterium]|nr:dihydropteroate synthase [Candidatus Dormibacteraeota bacterium]